MNVASLNYKIGLILLNKMNVAVLTAISNEDGLVNYEIFQILSRNLIFIIYTRNLGPDT